MELLHQFLDVFLHVGTHLEALVRDHGAWVYALLFLVVFCETGLVVTPFLPGDSLLFAVGALAMRDGSPLSLALSVPLLIGAAVLGDAVNFAIGTFVGPGWLEKRGAAGRGLFRFVKPEHLDKTRAFYEQYGSKTIVLARFVPIVRTFAPFVGGVGKMSYRRFALYNVVGAVLWVGICEGAGAIFGNNPWVKAHFEAVVLGIVAVSVLPLVVEFVRARRASST